MLPPKNGKRISGMDRLQVRSRTERLSTVNGQPNSIYDIFEGERRFPDRCLLLNGKTNNLAGGHWSNAVGFDKDLELLTGF